MLAGTVVRLQTQDTTTLNIAIFLVARMLKTACLYRECELLSAGRSFLLFTRESPLDLIVNLRNMLKLQSFYRVSEATVWSAAFVCIGLGLAVLVGWQWEIPTLKSIIPGAVDMKANTALGLVFSGLALLDRHRSKQGPIGLGGLVLSVAVFFLGFFTLFEYLSGTDLHIDQVLFDDTTTAYNLVPGRMSPMSAWTFMFIGISFTVIGHRKFTWIQILCIPQILLIGLVSLIGYLWHASQIVTDKLIPPVAVHTGFAFVALALGLVAARHRLLAAPNTNFTLSAVEFKMALGLSAIFLVLTGSFGFTYRVSEELLDSLKWVQHTDEVRILLKGIENDLKNVETDHQIFRLTKSVQYANDIQPKVDGLKLEIRALTKLVADNPSQVERAKQLEILADKEFLRLVNFQIPGKATEIPHSFDYTQGSDELVVFGQILTAVHTMDDVERVLLERRKSTEDLNQVRMLSSLMVSLGLVLLIFFALAIAVRREMLERLQSDRELRNLNEHLQQTVEDRTSKLRVADTRLSRFTYSLAHDLRQPLISCTGFVSLLLRDYASKNDDSKTQDWLRRIGAAIVRISAVTDAILEITRISNLTMRGELVDVTKVANELLTARLQNKRIQTLRFSVQPNMLVFCDKKLLSLALDLLIDNAWKFTGKAKNGSITVGLDMVEDTRTIWVKDNGVGFDMAYSDKLFVPFSRLHEDNQFGGLGIGLAFAQTALLQNSAKIWLESELGVGTTAFVQFRNQVVVQKDILTAFVDQA